ncbi:RidA family protein [Altererythrobacter aquiaggeris]|uniref:RidA family protein n=1 Tax=Aestuarierythrobacter aquiaggeris TaxID=1898396 RepID=UPI0030174D11
MTIEEKLASLGIVLPQPAAPVASYVAAVEHSGVLYVSGQLPFVGGNLITGKLGDDTSLEHGIDAARACGLMILAQAKAVLGSLDRVERVIKLGGFVNCVPDFTDQPKVINGASDLMFEVFGDAGRHARAAVGVPALPLGAAVEVDAIIAVSAG